MSNYHFMPFCGDDFMDDTATLTAAQSWAYVGLLWGAWRRADCSMPDDDRLMAFYARMDVRTWQRNKAVVMAFWTLSDGKWTQRRLLAEWKKAKKLSKEKDYVEVIDDLQSPTMSNKDDASLQQVCSKVSVKSHGTIEQNQTLTDHYSLQDNNKEYISPNPLKQIKHPKPPPMAASDLGFDEFWSAYPRREARGAAIKAYRIAARKTTPQNLFSAAKAYAAKRFGDDPKFTALPATWLNGERWLDGKAPEVISKTDVDDREWNERLTYGRKAKKWGSQEWGPMPGVAGCRVPKHLLADSDGAEWQEFKAAA